MEAKEAAMNALKYVMDAVPNENIMIISDDVCLQVAEAFAGGAVDLGLWTRLMVLKTSDEIRADVPQALSDAIVSIPSAIFITLFRESETETPFRIRIIDLITRYKKNRLGHCPGITYDMLTEGGLALSPEEHREIYSSAQRLMNRMADVKNLHVTSPSGTDVTLSVEGRAFMTDTKFDWKTFKWGNLPTGEIWAGPVENSLNGTIVCDLAIGGIGQIFSPMRIEARDGKAICFECDDKKVLQRVENALSVDEMAKVIGEFAFGLNRKARVSANFVEAEKLGEAVHFAFGHNTDMPGGMNTSATHMDFLVSKPTVEATRFNGEKFMAMKNGQVQ